MCGIMRRVKECESCHKPIDKPKHLQKYHEECLPFVRLNQTRERVRRFRQRHRDVLPEDLGTGNLKSHMNPDEEEEMKIVQNELRRLRLR